MNWIRVLAILAALVLHAGAGGVLCIWAGPNPRQTHCNPAAAGTISVPQPTVTLATEESLGLDSASVERQDASAGAPPQLEPKPEEPKKEDAVEATPPPPEAAPPQAPVQEKPPEKEVEKQETASPAAPAAPQEEQHAQSRIFEARRNESSPTMVPGLALHLRNMRAGRKTEEGPPFGRADAGAVRSADIVPHC